MGRDGKLGLTRRSTSLRVRVGVAVSVIVIALTVGLTLRFMAQREAALIEAVEAGGALLADSIGADLADSLDTGDLSDVEEVLSHVRDLDGVTDIRLLPPSEADRTDAPAVDLASDNLTEAIVPFLEVNERNEISLLQPISLNGFLVGVVQIELDNQNLVASLGDIRRDGLFTAIGTILLGVLGTTLLTGRAVSGVRRLTRAVDADGIHDLPALIDGINQGRRLPLDSLSTEPIDVTGGSEVDELAAAFTTHRLAVAALAEALEKRRTLSDERFRIGFERAPVGMAVLHPDGTVQAANPALVALLGIEQGVITGSPLTDFIDEESRDTWRRTLARLLQHEQPSEIDEVAYRNAGGEQLWTLQGTALQSDDDGDTISLFVQIQDITQTKRAQETLQNLAYHDALTGLPNRASFEQDLAAAMASGLPAVLMLDLDRFKIVNDSLGHHAGDRLLRSVGKRLRDRLRDHGRLSRLGGDEFVLLLKDAAEEGHAELVAERIVLSLDDPFEIDGRRFFVRASIGIAHAEPGQTPQELLANADAATYAAKARGRGRYAQFNAGLRSEAEHRLDIESELRDAIGTDQIVVEYQPIVSLTDGTLCSLEALVRWDHPVRGRQSPLTFIAIAEDTGLIDRLGLQVLDVAIRDLMRWSALPGHTDDWTVSVNVSGMQLRSPDVVQQVTTRLSATGVVPERIVLEVTESTLLQDDAPERLNELRQHGVRIAADDFGAGMTSIGLLANFPLDIMKIDLSLVQGAHTPRGQAILQSTAALASALDAVVVAEGVETAAQAETALEAGCQQMQGWLISRPVSADVVAEEVLGRYAAVKEPDGRLEQSRDDVSEDGVA